MRQNTALPNRLLILLGLVVLATQGLIADTTNDEKPSKYAPMADLRGQLEMYIEDIADDLEDEADYDEDSEKRVLLNANTLIVLGQTLGAHDEIAPQKAAAANLIEAATELADTAGDFAESRKVLETIQAAVQSQEGGAVDWEPAADLQALMQQVPIVNNSLRRAVMGRRFERMIDKSAGDATTLAAIAQASIYYTDYCLDEEDEAKWAKICVEMRDAATTVNAAVRRKDKAAATAGLAKLVETCDDCHHAFRD